MTVLPSILRPASFCHYSLASLAVNCLIFVISCRSSGLALYVSPLLMSLVVITFSSLYCSSFDLLKTRFSAYYDLSKSLSMTLVQPSALSCCLQSLVRQANMLGRISLAKSWLCSISPSTANIWERTVNRSYLIVLISENSYSIVLQFIKFLRTVTNSRSSLAPLIGWSNFRSSRKLSICKWQLFLRMFCYRMPTKSLISSAVSSSQRESRVFVLFVRTFTMLWVRFFIMLRRQSFRSNFLPMLVTKKPIPRVQLEAIFYLSLSLWCIIQSRQSFSYFSVRAVEKLGTLDQLDSPQLTFTVQFSDLYCLDSSSSNRTDFLVIQSVWNSGQKDRYPTSLIRAILTRELFFMLSMERKCSEVGCFSPTMEQKQCSRKFLAKPNSCRLQQSQSMQVSVAMMCRQFTGDRSRVQTLRYQRRKVLRASDCMLGSATFLWLWPAMSCTSSRCPLNTSSTNQLQWQFTLFRNMVERKLQMESCPLTLKNTMLQYLFVSLVKQFNIYRPSLSSPKPRLPDLRALITSISFTLMFPSSHLKYFSSIYDHFRLLLTSTERKLMHSTLSSYNSTILHSNSSTGTMQLLISRPIPSSKDILSIRVQLLHSSQSVLKISTTICTFFSQYSANSKKYKAFLNPEKMIKDLGTKEDRVSFSNFSIQALSVVAISFLPWKLAIMFSTQFIELHFTRLFFSKIESRIRLWSPKLLRIRFTISLFSSAVILASSALSRSRLTCTRKSEVRMLEVTHISQQFSTILGQCLNKKESRLVALIRIFWWAEYTFLSFFSSRDSRSPSQQSEHSERLENPWRETFQKLKSSQLFYLRLPNSLSLKVSLPKKHSLKINLMHFQNQTPAVLASLSPFRDSMSFSISKWQKVRKMVILLMDLIRSRLSRCWLKLIWQLLSMLQRARTTSYSHRKCFLLTWFSNRLISTSSSTFTLLYSSLDCELLILPSYSTMFLIYSSQFLIELMLRLSLVHYYQRLYLNS